MTALNKFFSGKSDHRGYLVLIGGAEDKRDDKLILKRMIDLNKAKNAVVIPTASNYPVGLAEDYVHAFHDCGVEKINILDIREHSEADKEEYLKNVEEADLIFFTGGDQVRLVDILNETKLICKIRERHLQGAVIAGTSAGAASASNPMIYDGDDRGLYKGSIRHGIGFGWIENITIDTHFIHRGRIGRLTQFLCTGQSTRGIGIGEDTAIFISPSRQFEVVGSGMVTVVNTENLNYNNYDEIEENDPINIQGIRVGFLQHACFFDMNSWDIIAEKTKTKLSPELVERIRILN